MIENWNRIDANPFWEYECYLTVSGDQLVVSNYWEREKAYLIPVDYGYFVGVNMGSCYDTGFVKFYPDHWAINDEVYQAELPPKLVAAERAAALWK